MFLIFTYNSLIFIQFEGFVVVCGYMFLERD